ncbi:Myb-like_DNA-binding domain-containing protein [Hexamita inflata]|uniref:Myb-like DNA-binding domain-containing protein n=1 Tax=Hexamita inflata TaxID=28002 RepID=A0AA86VBW1_9EUKA|nr:Myb-like DNA-binding domain-containing protein [Hexamita inflata]
MQNFDVSESRPNIYQNWSEAEIDRLIDVVERSQNYETGKINWTSVQLLFPERTLQQCKFFIAIRQSRIYSGTVRILVKRTSNSHSPAITITQLRSFRVTMNPLKFAFSAYSQINAGRT